MNASTPRVFEALLGAGIEDLPASVRDLHREGRERTYRGYATVTRGTSALSRVAGWLTHLPPAASEAPLQVTLDRTGNVREQHGSRRSIRSACTSILVRVHTPGP